MQLYILQWYLYGMRLYWPYPMVYQFTGATYIFPTIDDLIADGTLDEAFVDHVLKCECEAAGKAAFGEFYAKEGLQN